MYPFSPSTPFRYVIKLPVAILVHPALAAMLREVKLLRKRPGVLAIKCFIPGQSRPLKGSESFRGKGWGRGRGRPLRPYNPNWSTERGIYIVVLATCAKTAWQVLVLIKTQSSFRLGVNVEKMVQLMPAATGLLCLNTLSGTDESYDAFWLEDNFEVFEMFSGGYCDQIAVHIDDRCRSGVSLLLLCIQHMFENHAIHSGRLGHVKKSVWSFLGGSMHFSGLILARIGSILQTSRLVTLRNFHYAFLIGLRWDKWWCPLQALGGVAVHADRKRGFSVHSDLQIAGDAYEIESALRMLDQLRHNGVPERLVFLRARFSPSFF